MTAKEVLDRIKWGWKDALEWSQRNLVLSLLILCAGLIAIVWAAR